MVRVVWRMARVVIHWCFVKPGSFHLRSIRAKIITEHTCRNNNKDEVVGLIAGDEKSCVLPRAFTKITDSVPFQFTIVFLYILHIQDVLRSSIILES